MNVFGMNTVTIKENRKFSCKKQFSVIVYFKNKTV